MPAPVSSTARPMPARSSGLRSSVSATRSRIACTLSSRALQQRLCLDALDLELDLVELSLRTDAQLEALADLGDDGDLHVQVVDLDLDLVDLDDRDVDENVGPGSMFFGSTIE